MRRYLTTLFFSGVSFCVSASGVVTNVTVRQIQPWKGLLEIRYELSDDIVTHDERPLCTSVICEDREHGVSYAADSLTTVPTYSKGAHKLIWDARKDGVTVASQMVFRVSVGTAEYCVVDLSQGVSATKYPVAYMMSAPVGGWSDEYKTAKLVLRYVACGPFKMHGTYDVLYDVTLTKSFFIGVFEVTQRQWELVMGTNPSCFKRGWSDDPTLPVESVSYEMIRGNTATCYWPVERTVDPESFVGRLQKRTGLCFDLPTEAQWECSCRAGTTTRFSFGDRYEYKDVYRYMCCNYNGAIESVGNRSPNPWGLYNMHGNVREWCLDWYGDLYENELNGAQDPMGPSWPSSGSRRVVRGGCWSYGALDCTSASRGPYIPSKENSEIGFRLCRTLQGGEQ